MCDCLKVKFSVQKQTVMCLDRFRFVFACLKVSKVNKLVSVVLYFTQFVGGYHRDCGLLSGEGRIEVTNVKLILT